MLLDLKAKYDEGPFLGQWQKYRFFTSRYFLQDIPRWFF